MPTPAELLKRISFGKEGSFGEPCLTESNTRVSVILDLLAAGISTERILAEYPYLNALDIQACIAAGAEIARKEGLRRTEMTFFPSPPSQVDTMLQAALRGETEEIWSKLIEDLERELFTKAIELTQGNQAQAARWLGVSRLTMREKLTRFGARPSEPPGAP